MVLYIGGVVLVAVLAIWFYLLYMRKLVKGIASHIISNSKYSKDKYIVHYYAANAGYYISMCAFPFGITFWVTILSVGFFLLFIDLIVMFILGYYSMSIVCLIAFLLVLFSDVIGFFTFGKTIEKRLEYLIIRYAKDYKNEFEDLSIINGEKFILAYHKICTDLTNDYYIDRLY